MGPLKTHVFSPKLVMHMIATPLASCNYERD